MKYTKREIISAYRILTKNIQQNDLGWRGKMILSDVLDDYFSRIEGEKVVVDPKYGSFRCPKCMRLMRRACAVLDATWVTRVVMRICVSNLIRMEIIAVS
mgnify:CR=1 FL=1